MERYPSTIVVGTRPRQTVYRLQTAEILVQFSEEIREEAIQEILSKYGLRRAGQAADRAHSQLRSARMVWAATGERPALEIARSLSRDHSVSLVAPVYYAEGQGSESAASPLPHALVIRFKKDDDRTTEALQRFGLKHNAQMSTLLRPFHYFEVPEAAKHDFERAFDLLNEIAKLDSVETVEMDWLKLETYHLVPSDTFWANQWNMARIGLVSAWDVQTGDPAVWIAMIDSGFDLAHPDLQFTPNSGSTLTHFDADSALAGNPPPYNAGPSGVSHGMGTSGIAAARVNNSTGVAGVAGGCSVMPVRLGTVPSADRVAAGLNWAATNGARVASLSLSTTNTAAAIAAVANAWAAGLVICAATGNGGQNTTSPPVGFPANEPNVVAVGASDANDQRKRPASSDGETWGSQFGPEIDVVAPGVQCWTTDEQGATGNNANGGPVSVGGVGYPSGGDAAGDYFALFNGTSAATPHVSGLAALLFSQYPTLTNQQVRDIIERTCDKVSSGLYPYAYTAGRPDGTWHQEMGYGRINCASALRYADVMISDHSADTGAVPSCTFSGGVWTPDVFWGYQPYVTTTSQPAALPSAHEPAKAGQDNYVHALVHNNGPATAQNVQVAWHIMEYPNTELIWPVDWNAANQIASASIPSIAPGASVPVEALWPQATVDVAAGYIHPCMVVSAICASDVGGDLGTYVYQYNNIAQHNISFAAFLSANTEFAAKAFTLPFAVGNAARPVRRTKLVFDLRRAFGAAVFLDLNPPANLPLVDRIREAARKAGSPAESSCGITFQNDTRLLVDCCGCRADVTMKAGSFIRLLCPSHGVSATVSPGALRGATPVTKDGREQLRLEGSVAEVELGAFTDRILPMGLTLEVPNQAAPGRHYRVNVTQVSDGVPVGGVGLDVECK